MKKHKRITALALALMILVCLIPAASADGARAYWHEKAPACTDSFYQNWMSLIPDNTRINDISIPGTHDTMAWQGTVLLSDIMLTQTMTLRQQLNSGLRYLDIRLVHKGSYFEINHNFVDTRSSLNDVLNTVKAFFAEHPSETVVMRMQQEFGNASLEQVAALVKEYMENPEYSELFYRGGYDPTLGELRGKIYVLTQDFRISGLTNYYSSVIQDYFEIKHNWDLYHKWELVKEQLDKADSDENGYMYINHLSGAQGSMPYFVASGKASHGTNAMQLSTGVLITGESSKYPDFPRKALLFGVKEIDFMGTNQLAADYINANALGKVGILAIDFPGEAIIRAVIDCNFR